MHRKESDRVSDFFLVICLPPSVRVCVTNGLIISGAFYKVGSLLLGAADAADWLGARAVGLMDWSERVAIHVKIK